VKDILRLAISTVVDNPPVCTTNVSLGTTVVTIVACHGRWLLFTVTCLGSHVWLRYRTVNSHSQ